MKDSPSSAPKAVAVQPSAGKMPLDSGVYIPIVPEMLRPTHPLTFNLYRRRDDSRLDLAVPKGSVVAEVVKQEFSSQGSRRSLYALLEEKDGILEYEESVIAEVLSDPKIPMEYRCEAVRSLTTTIMIRIFSDPSARNISLQRNNVYRLVGFALKDKSALQHLVKISLRNYANYIHSVNVGFFSLAIAISHYGDTQDHNLGEMGTGFFLHDVGKCLVHDSILNKPGALNEAEWGEVRRHPLYGYNMLEKENIVPRECRFIILQHHERLDGHGYPDGLVGGRVHPYARICSIADAFDSLTSYRPFRKPLRPFEALNLMKTEVGTQFDPEFFRTFVLMMRKRT